MPNRKILFIVGLLMATCCQIAEAKWWCPRNRSVSYSLTHTSNWQTSCWDCHKKKDQGWQASILNIKRWQDDYSAFNEALGQLIPEGQYAAPNGRFSVYGESSYMPQGGTVFGYNSFTSRFGQTDMGPLYNMASRLSAQAQSMAGDATAGTLDLVKQEGLNQAQVATIIAKGQAVERAFRAASGDAVQTTPQTFRFQATFDQNGQLSVQPVQLDSVHAFGDTSINWDTVVEGKCINCHSGEQPSKGLDLVARHTWPPERQLEVLNLSIDRICHPDPNKRMPLSGPDNQPGEPLSTAEREAAYREKFGLEAALSK